MNQPPTEGTEARDAIESILKEHILEEFLPGEDPTSLLDTTPLISGGILDSISVLRFVSFVEERFGIEIQAHEVSLEYMDTVADLAALVRAKGGER